MPLDELDMLNAKQNISNFYLFIFILKAFDYDASSVSLSSSTTSCALKNGIMLLLSYRYCQLTDQQIHPVSHECNQQKEFDPQ